MGVGRMGQKGTRSVVKLSGREASALAVLAQRPPAAATKKLIDGLSGRARRIGGMVARGRTSTKSKVQSRSEKSVAKAFIAWAKAVKESGPRAPRK
jgi:hypothetical protein